MREGDLAWMFPFLFCCAGFWFLVFGFVFHHLDFVLSGTAVLRFGLFAAVVWLYNPTFAGLELVLCCGVFCIAHSSAKSS